MKTVSSAFALSCCAGAAFAHPGSLPHSHDGTGLVLAIGLILVAGFAARRVPAKA